MYSVLILNKRTTKSFNEYYPLFLNAIKNNKVAVCRWHEAGSDLDSLLPDLHKLTDDKKEWRAIIVRTEDDIDNENCSLDNPYDFCCGDEEYDPLKESNVPLIRLTHYLGGFPSPNVEFTAQTVEKEGLSDRVIYTPCYNEENDTIYEKLCDKYDYYGKKPSEIILITFSKAKKVKPSSVVKNAWKDYYEIHSSEFWKKNKYPSACRFISFDSTNEGPVKKNSDLFEFWSAVSLIATNDINPSFLQAYKLYSIKVDISKTILESAVQSTVTRLIGARHYVEREIREDLNDRLINGKKLPDYEVNVNVSIDAPPLSIGIDSKKFPICPTSELSDTYTWNVMKSKAFDDIDECIRYSEKALDESADIMRLSYDIPDETVVPLESYQRKQMEEDLSDVYSEIIRLQGTLPKGSPYYQKKLADKESDIKDNFVQRVKHFPAVATAGVLTMLSILSVAPALYLYFKEKVGTDWVISVILLSILVLFGLTELIVFCVQKIKTNSMIEEYNDGLRASVGELSSNAANYSKFIGKIATYTKGKLYLKKLSKKKYLLDDSYTMQQRHLKAINRFLITLKKWCVAYELDVSFDIGEEVFYEIDYGEKPQVNPLYSLFSLTEKDVPINKAGENLTTPLEFIQRFYLDREELYDEY